MEIRTVDAISVGEPSRIAEARRLASKTALELGFPEHEAGKVAIAATEASTNLVKHAREGDLIVTTERNATAAVIITAIDRGRGIANISESMRDGYSTAGSPGTGLGAIQRLASHFEIYSNPGRGTALTARFEWPPDTGRPRPEILVGGLSVAKPGEERCGDVLGVLRHARCTRLVIADGLGHGLQAAEAATAVVDAFRDAGAASLPDVIEAMHLAARSTRGAVAAVAQIDPGAEQVRFAGIGNISAAVIGLDRDYNLVSHNGTLGHELRKTQEFSYPWREGAVLVMHSDGVSRRWNLNDYPGLTAREPYLVAGVIYRDFKRNTDDAAVLIASAPGR